MCLNRKDIALKFTFDRALEDVTEIASADIEVYKRFRRYKDVKKGTYTYETPYRNFPWDPKATLRRSVFTGNALTSRDAIQVNQGLHAYTSLLVAKQHKMNNECIVKMIIPKGTKYILSDPADGGIVALAMKMKLPKKRNDRPKGANPKSGKKRVAKKKK